MKVLPITKMLEITVGISTTSMSSQSMKTLSVEIKILTQV